MPDELLAMVVALGREFSRLGMKQECERLRLYYLAVQHGLADRRRRVQVSWDEELTMEWLRVLRVPPFAAHYRIASETLCDRCEYRAGAVVTQLVFPGGAKVRCNLCGGEWLVLEPAR